MGRFYTIAIPAVSVSAIQDLFEYKAANGKPFYLHEVVIAQVGEYGDANAAGLPILIKRGTGAYTSGSGGTSATPRPHNTGDAAASGTANINNTTPAVAGSGALTTIRPEAFNEQSGYQYLPTPESHIFFAGGSNPEGCIINLPVAPAASCTVYGAMVIEEMG